MSSPGIALTPALNSELAEFWGFKYKEVKEELDALKQAGGLEANTQTCAELKRRIHQLQTEAVNSARRMEATEMYFQNFLAATKNEQRLAQQKLEEYNAEKSELLIQLARSNNERVALHQQIQVSYSQAASLAAEAHRQRMVIIGDIFPATSFVEDSFAPVMFNSMKRVVQALPKDVPQSNLYCLTRPPSSIPLRVPGICQAGYWFHPFNFSPTDSPFDLIVEVGTDTWIYYGRYVSRPFSGYEMKLSEWISLNEQVKSTFCARVANLEMPAGHVAPPTLQAEIRQRYEYGQWKVPCYTLQCVGFEMALHDALKAAKLRCESEVPISTLGKRRRTEPSRCGTAETEKSVKREAKELEVIRIEGQ